MIDTVIVDAVRTPIGRRNGALAGVHPADLSASVLTALAERSGISADLVDDVIWGCVSQISEQAFNIARTAVLSAGWPESVPGVTVDRQCGSSQQALHFAVAGVMAGHYDVVVAGGVESMSRVPMFSAVDPAASPLGPRYQDRYGPEFPSLGQAAEDIALEHGISRTEMDDYSMRSHQRAATASDSGAFDAEIIPVRGEAGPTTHDEGFRREADLATLAALRPAFRPDGSITAGNASQISDGAAGLLVMSAQRADQLGLRALARVAGVAVAGARPVPMLDAPLPATRKLLARTGVPMSEIGVFEVNEAFASVPLMWQREFAVDDGLLNPRGGAIALGHPLGASGARLMTTMVHHMRANKIRYGLQVMCEAGGMANATLLELAV